MVIGSVEAILNDRRTNQDLLTIGNKSIWESSAEVV